ncbi:hypothetical protein NP493_3335g00003 [Ridgeia piscesae]|uniref:Uncharacterized protein n=1 Tax=Ridgeia piscesae TaxID=27915 RepID=A0AAD9J913_RIDPI|nr:hypothetical protein NP493_3335g00003 [Ridgeia piscesae]
MLKKTCPLKLTVNCSRRLSLRSGAEGDKLRQDRPNNTGQSVDTHNLGVTLSMTTLTLTNWTSPRVSHMTRNLIMEQCLDRTVLSRILVYLIEIPTITLGLQLTDENRE